MLNCKALTKIQSLVLSAIIVVAALGGVVYVFWSSDKSSGEEIRIGVCGDLDNVFGRGAWEGAVLAAEQINAEGGVLGRNFTIVAEDDDSETSPFDVTFATNALKKLIAVDNATFIVSSGAGQTAIPQQDVAFDQKKIMFGVRAIYDELTQRVIDDYDRCKFYFRIWSGNATSASDGFIDAVLTLKNYTGFTKVAILITDNPALKQVASAMNKTLPTLGCDIVYNNVIPVTTTDFTSIFATIEASGAEMLVPILPGQIGLPFITEYYNRQSPVVVWGNIALAQESNCWDLTDGRCEYVSFVGIPTVSGYPLTNQTVPAREAYLERWNVVPNAAASATYDLVRFILPDALRRAGTIENEAVIKALEQTNVETSLARHFVFTSSHDVMVGAAGPNRPDEDYVLVCLFQWQNGIQVPVYPQQVMEEAGAVYKFPPWSGPWD
jgi:branched-chain amino acid transport system substrate-binding protein